MFSENIDANYYYPPPPAILTLNSVSFGFCTRFVILPSFCNLNAPKYKHQQIFSQPVIKRTFITFLEYVKCQWSEFTTQHTT
jgi:hypothetical protein